MERILIFSVYKIERELRIWRSKYPQYEIINCASPSEDCYVIFKLDLKSNAHHPNNALIGAQRGYVESFIKKPFSADRIFTPIEFENVILKKEYDMPSRQKDLYEELTSVIIELMEKNERLMIENAQLRAKILEQK